ncbi:MAG: METTL5 family protein [archaeon]
MTKSSLAVQLSKLKGFNDAKVSLEQYLTDPEIAAEILWFAHMQGDIDGKRVADLGAGTGLLGIGALLLGAKMVFLVEKDDAALDVARDNLGRVKFSGEVVSLNQDIMYFREDVDVVLMNPPFGTKDRYADREFLEKAAKIAPIIYSFHKLETKDFIQDFAKDRGFTPTHFWAFKFPLKASMKQHKKKVKFIEVGCWRFVKDKRKIYK